MTYFRRIFRFTYSALQTVPSRSGIFFSFHSRASRVVMSAVRAECFPRIGIAVARTNTRRETMIATIPKLLYIIVYCKQCFIVFFKKHEPHSGPRSLLNFVRATLPIPRTRVTGLSAVGTSVRRYSYTAVKNIFADER